MGDRVGIRHEDKYDAERRVAITPRHAARLIREDGLEVVVQSSSKRVFSDEAFADAGARVQRDLKDCPVIFGVKEVPLEAFEPGKTYVFFSHVCKGQPYNMPMLKTMMNLGCSLVDYERIVDDHDRRLIFFGRFAGLAGMINTLWSAGLRLREMGVADNPFTGLRQAHRYASLDEAKRAVAAAGSRIERDGMPPELRPFTLGFTGYGNVSKGAQEIAELLPIQELAPEALLRCDPGALDAGNRVFKIVFREEHLARRRDGDPFDLQHYYQHPEQYENAFEPYIPRLSVLLNGIYWDVRYPRIVTRDFLARAFASGRPKLTVIGDVTCDPDGSIEITHKGTPIEDPVFVYNPFTREPRMGFAGEGLLVMAVDILPSELPRDASEAFGDALCEFVPSIAAADYAVPFDDLALPPPIKRAVVLLNGDLAPGYRHLEEPLRRFG